MDHKIIVVGIGPGTADYLLPIAKRTIDAAKILVGSQRALQSFANKSSLQYKITGNIDSTLKFIRLNLEKQDIVVMVSGDPGYYSLLVALKKEFTQIEVIPGISSMQVAFARLSLPWQNAELISIHGREPELERLKYKPQKVIGMLTDGKYTTAIIAKILMKNGWASESTMHICNNLSYENEFIVNMSLEKASNAEEFRNCIVVVTE